MCPVVVRNTPVVFLHRQCKSYQTSFIESAQAKQILEHEHTVDGLLEVIYHEWAEIVAINAWYL